MFAAATKTEAQILEITAKHLHLYPIAKILTANVNRS
jgi:DNA-binding CsgD family transcriptional regulator